MSKIGKKPLQLPQGVQINVADSLVTVKGPKGEISKSMPDSVIIVVEGEIAKVTTREQRKDKMSLMAWGLTRALLQNMITGVTDGFTKTLEFQGVGYKASVKGNDLELGLGFSHPVTVPAPAGITFKTEKNIIQVMGMDKEAVGEIAAKIRSLRKPEPYKGSGIRYQGEIIKKKVGKKAATAA